MFVAMYYECNPPYAALAIEKKSGWLLTCSSHHSVIQVRSLNAFRTARLDVMGCQAIGAQAPSRSETHRLYPQGAPGAEHSGRIEARGRAQVWVRWYQHPRMQGSKLEVGWGDFEHQFMRQMLP